MGEINKVVILGGGDEVERIRDLLSPAVSSLVVLDMKGSHATELADADLVLEALPEEDLESHKEVLRAHNEKVSHNAILASTAAWGITELAAAAKRGQKFVGLNFTFNPLEKKCLVQITRGLESSQETVQSCKALVEKAGAVAVELEDSPGLILDRVIAAIINEAATMHMYNVASTEDIDKMTKLCLNWPMGPFEFADTIGIDRVVATLETLSRQSGQQYIPCRVLRNMVAAGRLGKKTGRGFYSYK